MTPFQFNRNGNAARRDPDAKPRVLLTGFEGKHAFVHIAGEPYQRAVAIQKADDSLIGGMDPGDAFKLGVERGEAGWID